MRCRPRHRCQSPPRQPRSGVMVVGAISTPVAATITHATLSGILGAGRGVLWASMAVARNETLRRGSEGTRRDHPRSRPLCGAPGRRRWPLPPSWPDTEAKKHVPVRLGDTDSLRVAGLTSRPPASSCAPHLPQRSDRSRIRGRPPIVRPLTPGGRLPPGERPPANPA